MGFKKYILFPRHIHFIFIFGLFAIVNFSQSAVNISAIETSLYPNGEVYQIAYDQRTGNLYWWKFY